MVLSNTLIFRGTFNHIRELKDELTLFIKKPNGSKLYQKSTLKSIKKLIVHDEQEVDRLYNLQVTFQYKKGNIKEFIDAFSHYPVEVIHLCESAKETIWIVNNKEYIKDYRLIPPFALNQILLDYMEYKDSAIILDSFETIKYDLNKRKITVDNQITTNDELLTLLFEKTIKGRYLYDIIDNFINSYYEKCINSYEELYSINKESSDNEVTTTPLALFVVTFGLFALVIVLLKLMGYF